MAKNNKNKYTEVTPEENEQLQAVLANYGQLAQGLAKSRNEEQIENVLSPIFGMSETAQVGLLKALAKERTTQAADIVLALNTYAPVKEVRKEARRSLIRLEGSNIYPEWTIPSVMSLSDILNMNVPEGFEDDDHEDDEDFEDSETLDGENIIERFLRSWGQGEFEACYDLLATNSPLKEGLTREAWIERRQTWATAAELNTSASKVDVGYALEDLDESLEADEEELDAFWSIEVKNTPADSLPELPVATVTLPATGRQWFWAIYTFVTEGEEVRIQSMRDKGAQVLQLPQPEVEARLQEIAEEIHAMATLQDDEELEDDTDIDDEDDEELEDDTEADDEDDSEDAPDLDEIRWFTKQSLHYCDALMRYAPEEADIYELAAKQATIISDTERAAAYLTLAAEHLPAERADILRSLGETYTSLTAEDTLAHLELEEELEELGEDEDTVAAEFTSRYFPLAEGALKESMAIDNAFSSYIILADLYAGQNKYADEARTLFTQAEALAENPDQKAAVALGRAQLAQREDNLEEALAQYQQAINLAPNIPTVWNSIGTIQLSLNRKEDAERSFLKSIQDDPATTEAYGQLATMYVEGDEDAKAIDLLEHGLDANPFTIDIITALAMLYVNTGNLQRAEELIDVAEQIEPNEIVFMIRQIIQMTKLEQSQRSSNPKSNKSKKRR